MRCIGNIVIFDPLNIKDITYEKTWWYLQLTLEVVLCFYSEAKAQPNCDIASFMNYVQGVGGADHMPVNSNNMLHTFSYEDVFSYRNRAVTTKIQIDYDRDGRIIGRTWHYKDFKKSLASNFTAEYYPYSYFNWYNGCDTTCITPYKYNGQPWLTTSRFSIEYKLNDTVITSVMDYDPAIDDKTLFVREFKDGLIRHTQQRSVLNTTDLQHILFPYSVTRLPAEYFLCLIQEDLLIRSDSLKSFQFTPERLNDTSLTYFAEFVWPDMHAQYVISFSSPYYTITETNLSRRRLRPSPFPSQVALIHYDGRPARITWYNRKTGKLRSESSFHYDQFGNLEKFVRRAGTWEDVLKFSNNYWDTPKQSQTSEP